MAKQKETSAMEIDDDSSIPSDQISNPKFSVNVLQLLKSAQMQHGLRFGDYARYRRYCTARLKRLYKSLKFTHGRLKYTKRSISVTTVTEVRFLHVVLYTAERAWSHAMEKKTLPDGPNAFQRSYLIGRLRKAVKWASLFQELCSIKGDSRTSLEAEAYAAYMKGSLLFEQDQNWDVAVKCFKSARAVYEELGKYGDLENQVLCRERVEELEPSIRYCLHNIGESNLQTSELVSIGEMEGPALDLFKAKLEAAMAEARSQQAASMTEFHWLGNRFPISNAKTRVSILKAQELEKDVHGSAADSLPAEKKLVLYDKIFAAYHEARSCIRNDLVTAANSENVKDELSGLDKAIGAILGQRTIERNQLLVKIAKSKLNKVRDDKNEKVTKPEELVRLYDLLLQNTADLSDLVSSGRGRKLEEVALAEECELKSMVFRAERCFYLAKSYSLAGKRTEAYALYSRARSLADAALMKLQSANAADQVMIKELRTLYNEIRSNSCVEHAKGIMEEENAPENLSKKISNISLTGADKKMEKLLMEKMDMYESAVGANMKVVPRIETFPPAFQSVPRNPIVLDLAYNLIEFPSLDARMKKDKKGFISRFWS
ncbi:putative myb-related protein Myb4-like [Capsicum annuum]|uniref:signal recognition particle subunit SRP68 n=1 Tax=Capsicum annuum TaxID=4072 RepID=UPI001FB1332B|nr:signal recognition particle subunit SRP68 [Capsicum annuum]KAF3645072.1 putative myb-related protein Myb4-like [Capsicum annuum]